MTSAAGRRAEAIQAHASPPVRGRLWTPAGLLVLALVITACGKTEPITPLTPATPIATPTPAPTPPAHPTGRITLHVSPGLSLEDTVFHSTGSIELCVPGANQNTPLDGCAAVAYGKLAELIAQPEVATADGCTKTIPDEHGQVVPCPYPTNPQPHVWIGVTGERSQTPAITLTPGALAHKVWDNFDSPTESEFVAQLSDSISIGAEWGWEKSQTTGHEYSISVEVGFGDEKAGSGDAYSFSTTTGSHGSHTQERDVGTDDEVKQEVPAGEGRLVILLIQHGEMTAELDLDPEWYGDPVTWCRSPSLAYSCGDEADGEPVLWLKDLRARLGDPGPPQKLTLELKFVADSDIKVVDLPANDPDTIRETIDQAVEAYGGAGGVADDPASDAFYAVSEVQDQFSHALCGDPCGWDVPFDGDHCRAWGSKLETAADQIARIPRTQEVDELHLLVTGVSAAMLNAAYDGECYPDSALNRHSLHAFADWRRELEQSQAILQELCGPLC